ncbi:T-cell immunoglobulin and mucin domain-containing protein 4 [Amia ocellicauda]|uniref:T-cell immunoglobulin and mucin domain-containing protein 4 n=1 Tax=Amia ocellicauda TaxID=2972642 RepID=UPI0034645FDB
MAPGGLAWGYTVLEGEAARLSCRYSVKKYGLSRVCWGRHCGALWCTDIIIQTDGTRVVSKLSDRYRLDGDVPAGQVDLTIPKVTRRDSGRYCCRVDIEGYFNDQKLSYTLRVLRAPTLTTPPGVLVTPTPGELGFSVSAGPAETGSWLGAAQGDGPKLNSSVSHSGGVEESPLPRHSLQINVPVLAVSVTVLLPLLLGSLALLGLKRRIQKRSQKESLSTRSAASAEPRHIIYEIQARRPVEENIYTLE